MIMKNKKNVPDVRFKGFAEEWKEKIIEDIAPLQRGFDLPNQNIIEGDIPIAYSNGILNYHNKPKCKAPGIVTGRSGTIGNFTFIKEGYYWPHNTSLWVTDFCRNIPAFIYYLYQTINIKQFSMGSGVPTLNRNDVHKCKCKISINNIEQQAIGNYFQNIDRLINISQTKFDKLKNIKNACLEKMFPRNGSNIPEVRFKGFMKEWEEQIMAKIGNPYNGLSGKTKEDFGCGDARFITYMNVFLNPVADLYRTENVEIDNKQNNVQYGDILFTVSSETPEEVGMSSVWLGHENYIYLNSFCFGYRLAEYKDPYYIAYLLRSKSVRKKIAFLAQGISRYNISKNKVMEIELPFPDPNEQQAIGRFFKNLDSLIAKTEQQINKLKNIKKACLDKMFINPED